MGTVVVAGLGPAGPDLFTAATVAAVDRIPRRWLRTERHPAAAAVGGAGSFDHVYESSPSLEAVYVDIVDALVADAEMHGEVPYLVPGSPLVAERTVELLRADPRVEVVLVAALSFLDLAWARLGIDPVRAGVRLVDGQRFAVEAAGERGPLVVAQCDSRAVLSEVKLAAADGDPDDVVVLRHLGLPDEEVASVAWAELDRVVEPDHLTSLYLPTLSVPVASEVARFAELVRTLRQRCPWDREQTHQSLTRHLLEETYEVLEAIEGLDRPGADGMAHLEEELGDLLFQVVFHATLAAEEGAFTLADVARGIHDKLVHRHPHVFGEEGAVRAETADAVVRNWEQIKQAEKGRDSLMDGIAGDLPSLLYAHKLQRKAASVGVDVAPLAEGDLARTLAAPGREEVGRLLFGVVDVARRNGIDPESALRGVSGVFQRRFRAMEELALARGVDLSASGAEDAGALWSEVWARRLGD